MGGRGGAAAAADRRPGLARACNDAASLRSSTSRLANLYHQSGLAPGDGSAHLDAARSVTQERAAAIRAPAGAGTERWRKHTMRYFFAVLADQLGLRAAGASD